MNNYLGMFFEKNLKKKFEKKISYNFQKVT